MIHDNSIVNHGERLASVETSHKELKAAVEKADTRQWYHSLVVAALGVVSHLGLGKLGWKI